MVNVIRKPGHYAGKIMLLMVFFCSATGWGEMAPGGSTDGEKQKKPDRENYTIKMAVEEVRLDAVVLRTNWKTVTDLTADDFEIYQDNVRQKVTGCVYVPSQNSKTAESGLPGTKKTRRMPLGSHVLEKENVNRVLLFIVDDLSGPRWADMALKRFVERQMQPGDMVGILKTSNGNSALNVFTSDKRELLAKIENLETSPRAQNFGYGVYEGQISMLGYGIRALKDMPGRKTMILLTNEPNIRRDLYMTVDDMFADKGMDYKYIFGNAYDRLADEALRARVVIHVMDMHGLWAPDMEIPRNLLQEKDPDLARIGQAPFIEFDKKKLDPWNPLPFKTGGTLVKDFNFFLDGIGEKVNNMLQGYYLLSYIPPEGTFAGEKRNIYHKIKIRVKRRGMDVYARDGFFGRMGEDADPRYQDPLQEAVFSPFLNKDINVNLTSGFLHDAKAGYVLRSWLHVDPRDVTITEKPGEGYFASLKTVCLTSNVFGFVQDARMIRYDFKIQKENLPWVQAQGLRFSILLPVKQPGSYYVRTAVKDMDSGKIGSAYQFIQIPDLKKKRPALANLFIMNREEDVSWIRDGVAADLVQKVIKPVVNREDFRSPAIRRYVPGDSIRYMTVLYNAKKQKEKPLDVELQSILYKDGAEVSKTDIKSLKIDSMADYARIPFSQSFALDASLSKGNYVLELQVRDKNRSKKKGSASQILDFQIADH